VSLDIDQRDYCTFAFDLAISRDYGQTDGRTYIGQILNVGWHIYLWWGRGGFHLAFTSYDLFLFVSKSWWNNSHWSNTAHNEHHPTLVHCYIPILHRCRGSCHCRAGMFRQLWLVNCFPRMLNNSRKTAWANPIEMNWISRRDHLATSRPFMFVDGGLCLIIITPTSKTHWHRSGGKTISVHNQSIPCSGLTVSIIVLPPSVDLV
jgi:hypothetical protein